MGGALVDFDTFSAQPRSVHNLRISSMRIDVISADNGGTAVELYKQRHDELDVIVCDLHMPILDGYETTQAIRAFEEEHGLMRKPIVAIKADSMSGTKEACIDAGMDLFLTKPIRKATVNALLLQLGLVKMGMTAGGPGSIPVIEQESVHSMEI